MTNVKQLHKVLALAMVAVVAAMSNTRTATALSAGPGCLHVPRGYAPSADAKNAIQDLLDSPNQCCKKELDQFCSPVASSGDAELYVCGCNLFCVPCRVAGSYLSSVVNSCVDNDKIQGFFSLDGTSCRMLYVNRLGTWRSIKPIRKALSSFDVGAQTL
ncbi:hypothetical protein MPTK1_2g18750 [Marchantia polymorpha subsp. ruderalis]|uniref:Gnk2-homologous domain-containing protein n=1 Tax=Marchantia polymorpha TaxID=3197 RepID=A0A2R6W715_MARPO|nr:hypothetical protein MARPO_0137s0007 [Marchantia polymorpha]BBN02863.1 hypothetical protein Mp_2g18750 [Marchantia polymorpha subsp. ruderalis]|eukprot:PTQ29633.1 hypothetical protein MARPO_0137s0007 [Marchantia polymorpha]